MNRRFIVLILVLVAFILLLAAASASASLLFSFSQSPATTYSGSLSLMWIDYQDGTAATRFYLTTTAGKTIELLPAGQVSEATCRLWRSKRLWLAHRLGRGRI